MSRSLGEVQVMVRLAVHGAGYSWSLADEAGRAARWLCINGHDGCATVANAFRGTATSAPAFFESQFQIQKETLCSLKTGVSLSDFAHVIDEGPVQLGTVGQPGFLLPFIAQASRRILSPVKVSWPGGLAITDGRHLRSNFIMHSVAVAENVVVEKTKAKIAEDTYETRAYPSAEDWALLESFAKKTYAPATAESRILGAG